MIVAGNEDKVRFARGRVKGKLAQPRGVLLFPALESACSNAKCKETS
jgi:hypothetical protein